MAKGLELYSPDQARHILSNFVNQAEQKPEVDDYQDLKNRVGSEIGISLNSLIIQTGQVPYQNNEYHYAVLKNKRNHSLVNGTVIFRGEDRKQSSIMIEESRRIPLLGRRSKQWAHMGIYGINEGSAAHDTDNLYLPFRASESYINSFRNMDETFEDNSNNTQTSLGLIEKATINSITELGGYLRVASEIIKKLIAID